MILFTLLLILVCMTMKIKRALSENFDEHLLTSLLAQVTDGRPMRLSRTISPEDHTHVSTRRVATKIISSRLDRHRHWRRRRQRVPSVWLTRLFLGPHAITGSIRVISWNGVRSTPATSDWTGRNEVIWACAQPATRQPETPCLLPLHTAEDAETWTSFFFKTRKEYCYLLK
jgi:hypothetical protein